MAAENTIKLYWDCANALSAETHTAKLLKSYYMTACRKLARRTVQIPKEKFAPSRMCPRCSSQWSESDFQMKARPQHIASTAKARRLIAKLDEMQKADKRGLLTKKQCRRAKWLKKRTQSSVEIECKLCKHKTRLPLEKPKEKEVKPPQAAAIAPTVVKKKKQKKKNKTAGLKLSKVQNTQPDEKPIKLKSTQSKANTIPKGDKSMKPINTNSVPATKTKNKKKKSNKVAATCVAPKVQSKTQQQNSLLQLAALLKTQASTSKTSTQKRLESLLK